MKTFEQQWDDVRRVARARHRSLTRQTRRRNLTSAETEFAIKAFHEGISHDRIAKHLGRQRSVIWRHLHQKHGIKRRWAE